MPNSELALALISELCLIMCEYCIGIAGSIHVCNQGGVTPIDCIATGVTTARSRLGPALFGV